MNYNPFSLKGKTILVTGASSGIGRATAIECAKMGARLILTARNEERLKQTLQSLEAIEGEGHQMILADLSDSGEIDKLVNGIPQLDGLVNNAGISKLLPIQFINEQDLTNILQVNAIAPILLTQKIYKKKKINRGGSIVFTSSIGGVFRVTPGNAMYGVSKGAINVFMKSSALEMATKGIRCNSVNPGMVNTHLINRGVYTDEDRERDINTYPLKRYGEPEEVAYSIIYLLSDASAWVTGISLVIDGGVTL